MYTHRDTCVHTHAHTHTHRHTHAHHYCRPLSRVRVGFWKHCTISDFCTSPIARLPPLPLPLPQPIPQPPPLLTSCYPMEDQVDSYPLPLLMERVSSGYWTDMRQIAALAVLLSAWQVMSQSQRFLHIKAMGRMHFQQCFVDWQELCHLPLFLHINSDRQKAL